MKAQTIHRYKKGDIALFNGMLIKIHQQLGVTTSDFSNERCTAVAYQFKVGRRWSGAHALLVVHNKMIVPSKR